VQRLQQQMVSNNIIHSSPATARAALMQHVGWQQHMQSLQQQLVINGIIYSSSKSMYSSCNMQLPIFLATAHSTLAPADGWQQQMDSNRIMHFSSNGKYTCSTCKYTVTS
jgi:hypothetical protein